MRKGWDRLGVKDEARAPERVAGGEDVPVR